MRFAQGLGALAIAISAFLISPANAQRPTGQPNALITAALRDHPEAWRNSPNSDATAIQHLRSGLICAAGFQDFVLAEVYVREHDLHACRYLRRSTSDGFSVWVTPQDGRNPVELAAADVNPNYGAATISAASFGACDAARFTQSAPRPDRGILAGAFTTVLHGTHVYRIAAEAQDDAPEAAHARIAGVEESARKFLAASIDCGAL